MIPRSRFSDVTAAFPSSGAVAVIAGIVSAALLLTLIVLLTSSCPCATRVSNGYKQSWAPAAFYLWAFRAAPSSALARGGLNFQPLIAQALSRVGWALALGAGVSVAAAPLTLSLGGPHAFGGFAVFDVPALTLGVVGLALIVLANMLRRATAIEAEATKLKATLQEFV